MDNWQRSDTYDWMVQLENRIEDMHYYLEFTVDWCEQHEVTDNETAFACALMALVWVSYQRDERISKREALEILQIVDWQDVPDEEFQLSECYWNLSLDELLHCVLKRRDDF